MIHPLRVVGCVREVTPTALGEAKLLQGPFSEVADHIFHLLPFRIIGLLAAVSAFAVLIIRLGRLASLLMVLCSRAVALTN